jgi:hypothetical protein
MELMIQADFDLFIMHQSSSRRDNKCDNQGPRSPVCTASDAGRKVPFGEHTRWSSRTQQPPVEGLDMCAVALLDVKSGNTETIDQQDLKGLQL